MSRITPRTLATTLVTVGAIVLTACGGAAQPSPSATVAPTPAATIAAAKTAAPTAATKPGELDAAIVAKAESEGAMVLYTSMDTEDSKPLVDAFMKAYPKIKATLNRKSSSKILTQFKTEAKAGKVLADVLETGGVDVASLIKDGLTVPITAPAAKDFPKEFTQLGGHFINARSAVGTFGWNTKLVPAGQEPKTWEDLLDPKWKGQILVEAGDWDVMQALAKGHFNNDDAKVRDYFTKLAANQPILIDGHTEELTALVAGQGKVAFGIRGDTVQGDIEVKKVPLGWSKDEVMLRLQGPIIAKGAPHPSAALVFVNWYLSKEGGQKFLAGRKRIPAAAGLADPVFTFKKTITSGPEDAAQLPKYEKLWNELIVKK